MKITDKSQANLITRTHAIITSAIIGILLLIFTISATKAAEFSIFESVKNLLGRQAPSSEQALASAANQSPSKGFSKFFSLNVSNINSLLAIPLNPPVSQNFNGIGTTATASLPTDFKVDKNTTARSVGTYSAAGTATEQVDGASVSSSATNGIYNFGSGTTDTGSDRAIGFLSSSSATKSGNLYVQINNNTGNALSGLQISYDVEKYRNGSNPAGFSIQMYYSPDGSTWTSAGSNFLTSFAADGNNNGFSPAPGATVSITNQTLNQDIFNGDNFYLAWNYSVTSGTTTTNAQALAIDNINITAITALPTTLGNYADTTVNLSGNATVTPDVAPTNATSATATITTDFKGELEVNPSTGVVNVTNAHPAGTYTVAVRATNALGTTTKTFNLTVTTPAGCGAFNATSFASSANFAVGSSPSSVAVGDLNGDGKQDVVAANVVSSSVSVLLRNATNDGFDAAANLSVGSGSPQSVAIGDLNGDGKQDIVTANSSSGKISVLLRNAANTGFDTFAAFSAGSFPFSVAIADFNADGKQDIVASNGSTNNTVSVLLRNTANDGFDAAASFTVGAAPDAVAVGDFNSDGKPDIATANFNSSNISVLLRNATNDGFDPKDDYSVGSSPRALAVGDFNGDGKPDIVASYNGNLAVLLRNGANTGFDAAAIIPVSTTAFSVSVGDFNNDGKQDIVTANGNTGNTVSVLLRNTTNDGFDAAVNFAVGTNPRSVAIGDFNGDNRQDVVAANLNNNNISVLQRVCNNPPSFSSVTNQNRPQNTSANSQIATVTDDLTAAGSLTVTASTVPSGITVSNIFNNNGTVTADVGAGSSTAPGDYTVVLTVSDGELSTNANLIVTVPSPAPEIVVKGNNVIIADNDTTPSVADHTDFDTVSVGNTLERTFTIENIGNSSLTIQNVTVSGGQAAAFSVTQQPGSPLSLNNSTTFKIQFAPTSLGSHSTTVNFGNNDSDENPFNFVIQGTGVVAATLGNYADTTIALSGNTTVTPDAAPTNTLYLTVATTADFKGELEIDPSSGIVRVTNAHPAGSYTITIRATNAGGTTTKTFALTVTTPQSCALFNTSAFATAVNYAVNLQPESIAVGDFNADGKQDIVAANGSDNSVSVLLRNATNTGFDSAVNFTVGNSPYSVAVGDFNADGKQDIVAANGSDNSVSVLLRNATNTGFDSAVNFTVGNSPYWVAVGDFNGDGKQDIVTANRSDNNVSVLLRNAANTGFDPAVNFFVGTSPRSVAVGDFNNDGKQDIVAANSGTNGGVSVLLRNTANTGFDAAVNLAIGTGTGTQSVAVGDFNSDGKQDIVVGNNNTDNVSVLLRNVTNDGFDPKVDYSVGVSPTSVAIGDFNNDGKQDIAVANGSPNSSSISVLLRNTGNNGFDPKVDFTAGIAPESVAIGDFNNDGKQDIAVANGTSNNVSVLLRNCPPTITPSSALTRQKGTAASNSQIATVSDAETAAGNLTVQATTVPSGITVSNIVNNNGTITADVAADCSATTGDNTIVLTVTDSVSASTTANLIVNVTANTAPTLTYPNASVLLNGSTTVNPSSANDNGTVAYSLQSQGTYTGTILVNSSTGAISISSATPTGTHTITIRATDNCGATTDASFTLTVNQSPAITSADNTTFTVGTAGSFTVTTTGFPTSSISRTGSLPNGVTFTDNGNGTATLAGTPAAGTGGSYPLTITASNGIGSNAVQNFTLTINQAPAFTSANNTTFTVGTPGNFQVSASGNPASTFSTNGTLPSGVTLSGAGLLSGTPTAGTGGVYNFTITASNGVSPNATQNFTLTVNQAPAFTSANNTTFTVGNAGSFQMTATGNPAPTFSTNGSLPSGVTLSSAGLLSGTPAAGTGGTYQFTVTATNGVSPDATQNFTLTVNQAPAITSANSATFTVGANGSFNITTNGFPAPAISKTGALPNGVTFTDNGNGTATLAGTPAAGTGGSYPLTITASNGIGSNAVQNFTLTINQAPAFTSANNTTFTVGTAGSFQMTASGNPASTFSTNGALPSGITLSSSGLLSGTPAAGTGGTYQFTVTATNGVAPDATQSFTLTVNQAPVITSANSTTFTQGTAGNFQATATGFPAPTFSVFSGTLPSGITLSSAGLLSGTTNQTGVFTFTIRATNVAGTNDQAFTLTVNPPFTVTAASPNQNALNAARASNVSAAFSHNVNQSTVTANTFKVSGSGTAGYGGTISFPDASSAQLDPTNNFKAGELITAVLSRNIQSAAGINLTPFIWQFRAATSVSTGRMIPHPTNPSFDGGADSQEVELGDLDNDGDLDAVIANGGGNSFNPNQPETVLMNNGSGVFTPHPTIPSFGSHISVAVELGDIDGDGDLDALVSNYSQNETVWKNDGTGGFTLFSSFSTPATVDIELGDIDGDGDLDTIVTSDGGNQTAWVNDGSGNFSPNPASPTLGAGNMFDADLADIDGDGDLDVVFTFYYGDETVWKNDGNGGFTLFSSFGAGASNSYATALGDIDGDGDLDAVVANTNDQAEQIWKNDGSGNFSLHQSFDAGSGNSSHSLDVVLGDIDGDGDLDILVANHVLSPEKVWVNNGSGTFAPHSTVPSFGAGHSTSIGLGDLDGDGDLDALVGNDFGTETVWLNNTAPTITPSSALTRQQGTAASNSQIAAVGDVETAPGSLTVQATTVPSGITVSNIVNTNGTITADIAASCSAATGNNTVVLTVTDADNTSTTANLTVNVTANTAPTLTYGNTSVSYNGSTTNNTSTAADNGTVTYSLQGQGTYTGTISVNGATGAVSFSNAAPAGTHTITIRATDNCGLFTDASFTLNVNTPPTIAKSFSPSTIVVNGISTLTISITNPAANNFALTGVGVTDNFPAGIEVDAVPAATNSCATGTFATTAGAPGISVSDATIPVNTTCAFTVKVKATTLGAKLNTTGNVTSANGGTGGTASATLMVNSYEADISPRPNGDGSILSDDVVQIRRFLNGTNAADQTTDEFQRADSSPFVDRGDGRIFSDDVVQARRYQNGTNTKQLAAGPMTQAPPRPADAVDQLFGGLSKTVLDKALLGNPREVRVENAMGSAGQNVTVNIRVNAVGNESEYGFIINYDSTILSNPVVGAGTAGASVRSCNIATIGQVNCSVGGFPTNNPTSNEPGIGEIAAGNNQLLITVQFTIAANAQPGTTPLTLSNVNASSDAPQLFFPTATNGTVTILAPTAAASQISGRVMTADGRAVSRARLTLTDQNGEVRSALTNPFGYYRFTDIAAGETYVISVSHKQFRFDSRVINANENLSDIDFIASEIPSEGNP